MEKINHQLLKGYIEQLKSVAVLNEETNIIADLKAFERRLEDADFRIAVIGEFSSGKSTFLNALLKQDILSHATKETTATITRIINVAEGDPRAYTGLVRFADGKVEKINNLSELKDFTTTESSTYNVVEQIAGVDLYIPVLPNGRRIVFIDTPGLNGTADGHREQTIQVIKEAHACVYMLSRHGVAQSDIDFLNEVAELQNNFIFVQNFIDELNSSEGDTLEEKLRQQKVILEDKVNKLQKCNYELCGVSALKALVARDTHQKRLYADSDRDITDAERVVLEEQSHIQDFLNKVNTMFSDETIAYLQVHDTAYALHNWIKARLLDLNSCKNMLQDGVEAQKDKFVAEKIARYMQELKEKAPEREKNLANMVTAFCGKLQKDIIAINTARINELTEVEKKLIDEILNYEDLESYAQRIPARLKDKLAIQWSEDKDHIDLYLYDLVNELTNRINTYTGIRSDAKYIQKLDIDFDIADVQQPEVQFAFDIDTLYERFAKAEKRVDELTEERLDTEKQIEANESNIARLSREKSRAEGWKSAELASLGEKPEYRTWTEYEEYYRDRTGCFSSITNFFFGQKKDVREVTKDNRSEVNAYENRKHEIEARYNEEIRQKEAEIEQVNIELKGLQCSKERLSLNEQAASQNKSDLGKRIEDQKQLLEKAKQIAEKEYLKLCRKKVKEQLDLYLGDDGEVIEQMNGTIKDYIKVLEKKIIAQACECFKNANQKELETLANSQNGNVTEQSKRLVGLEKALERIKNIDSEMEAYL